MIRFPKSLVGDAAAFAARAEAHRAAVEAHMMGEPGTPAPVEHTLITMLIERVPASGPVADRGPDTIAIAPYEIFDDAPPPADPDPAIELALQTLRATILG